jgi:hypothetical protein
MDPDPDLDPDPVISSLAFKRPTKTNLNKKISAYYFLKVHVHLFSKIKSQKEVTKQKVIEGSGSLTNGSGSRRPQNK